MNKEEIEIAQTNFWKRKDENKGKRINNSDLPAGAPMYFYCRHCDELTATLPEGYIGRPITICRPCEELEKTGSIPRERPIVVGVSTETHTDGEDVLN